MRTEKWQLYPAEAGGYDAGRAPSGLVGDGFPRRRHRPRADCQQRTASRSRSHRRGAAVPVLAVSAAWADALGLQERERYLLAEPGQLGQPLTVTLVGVWEPADQILLTGSTLPQNFGGSAGDETEAVFSGPAAPQVQDEVGLAAWYLVADDRAVNATAIGGLEARIAGVRARLGRPAAESGFPDVCRSRRSKPTASETSRLTLPLFAFGIPILALILTLSAW